MSTPLSGTSAYATASDFTARYDARTVAQLLSDADVQITSGQVPSNASLAALLQEASGMLESACLVGQRYQPADLSGLTGNSMQMLIGIVCGVGMYLLWCRRPEKYKDMKLPSRAELALRQMDDLRDGSRIFGILEAAEANNIPTPYFTQPNDLYLRNPVSVQARRFFGNRGQYNVPGPQ